MLPNRPHRQPRVIAASSGEFASAPSSPYRFSTSSSTILNDTDNNCAASLSSKASPIRQPLESSSVNDVGGGSPSSAINAFHRAMRAAAELDVSAATDDGSATERYDSLRASPRHLPPGNLLYHYAGEHDPCNAAAMNAMVHHQHHAPSSSSHLDSNVPQNYYASGENAVDPDETIAEGILRCEREQQFHLIDRAKVIARRLLREADRQASNTADGFDAEEEMTRRLEAISSKLSAKTTAIRQAASSLDSYRKAQLERPKELFSDDHDTSDIIVDPDGTVRRMLRNSTLLSDRTLRAQQFEEDYVQIAQPILYECVLPLVFDGIDTVEERRRAEQEKALDALNNGEAARRERLRVETETRRAMQRTAVESAMCVSDDPYLSRIRKDAHQRRVQEQKAAEEREAAELAAEEEKLHRVKMRVDREYRAKMLEEERKRNMAPKDLAALRAELEAIEREERMEKEAAAAAKRAKEQEETRAAEEARQVQEEEAAVERNAIEIEQRIQRLSKHGGGGGSNSHHQQQAHYPATSVGTHSALLQRHGSPTSFSRYGSPSRSIPQSQVLNSNINHNLAVPAVSNISNSNTSAALAPAGSSGSFPVAAAFTRRAGSDHSLLRHADSSFGSHSTLSSSTLQNARNSSPVRTVSRRLM